jgi:hypothetical protein
MVGTLRFAHPTAAVKLAPAKHNLTRRLRHINSTGKSLRIYGNHVKPLDQKYTTSVYPKYAR